MNVGPVPVGLPQVGAVRTEHSDRAGPELPCCFKENLFKRASKTAFIHGFGLLELLGVEESWLWGRGAVQQWPLDCFKGTLSPKKTFFSGLSRSYGGARLAALSLNPGSPLGFGARVSGLLCFSAVLLPAVCLSCRRPLAPAWLRPQRPVWSFPRLLRDLIKASHLHP